MLRRSDILTRLEVIGADTLHWGERWGEVYRNVYRAVRDGLPVLDALWELVEASLDADEGSDVTAQVHRLYSDATEGRE